MLFPFRSRDDSRVLLVGGETSISDRLEETLKNVGPPTTQLIRYSHIPIVFDTSKKALRDDPVELYVVRPEDTKGSWKFHVWDKLSNVVFLIDLCGLVRTKRGLTIKKGRSVILWVPAVDAFTLRRLPSKKPPPRDTLASLAKRFKSPQQLRRGTEWKDKLTAAIQAVIGDEANQYYYIDGLATHPDYQGHGFATTLLNAVLQLADDQGRPTWLGSSNIMNTGFYESFGFVEAARITLGDDPEWTSEPVIALLMVRPAKDQSFYYADEKAQYFV
ncbi:hypothetical protein BV25DRAFT_1821705 [Artomyces pyxidatus]|uniref:Uncharacterized protein n=1 Tax=Artomyces pyxidatus TaxID=48021 RepID=A0ACB8TBP2_9AGAM|nr:hypothetical protein BV25DRAFT_1821705 [Artomyces pyxidatus]